MAINGEFKGLCLETVYHYLWDGDYQYVMLVWDPVTKTTHTEFVYDSRGASAITYDVDATPEVKAEYADYLARLAAHKRQVERNAKAVVLHELRVDIKSVALQYGFKTYRLQALRHVYTESDFKNVLDLLFKNIRSEFKKSLRKQVVAWLQDEHPDYKTPLSPKQLSYLVPVDYSVGIAGYKYARHW